MNGNLAYQEEPREELLNGEIVMMASPSVNHYQITLNIVLAFQSYLKGKTCRAFGDGVDVFLTENDRVIPDAMIVCNKNNIKLDGIHGAPDLVVEVGYKKDLYEKAGVKEYWIIDPMLRSIEVYLLTDGEFALDEVYALYPDGLSVTDKEREETKKEIQVSLYNDFCISLGEIFKDLL